MRLGIFLLMVGSLAAEDQKSYTFGTTVVDSSGLEGKVYFLNPKTEELPNFSRMKPEGKVYTTSLNVWPQSFDEGFPNLTDRFEWFGIEYSGRFWIENPGQYRFSLLSDDGSKGALPFPKGHARVPAPIGRITQW